MSQQEVLDYLYHKLPMYQQVGSVAFKKDLTNIHRLCESLANPHRKFKSIHIAGTNGKGSSAHAIAAVLQSAGYKTGLYTSPHLKNFTERIRIDGKEIDFEYVAEFVKNNKALIEEINPSFFEITVAMAFTYFAKKEVDIAIIETGLGGRLDSTNVIVPEVALITNISYDHQNMLGDTLAAIAKEKAGIFKKGVPVVISERQDELVPVFQKVANEIQTNIAFASDQWHIKEIDGKVNIHDHDELFVEGLLPQLKGKYQYKNYPGVFSVLEILNRTGYVITKGHIKKGLENLTRLTGLKGRWQVLGHSPIVLCDIAHNESGISEVFRQLTQLPLRQLHIVWGMVNDKDGEKILKLLPKGAKYYFCAAKVPRAMEASKLTSLALKLGYKGDAYDNVISAIAAAKAAAQRDDGVYIGGSTFVVAEIDGL